MEEPGELKTSENIPEVVTACGSRVLLTANTLRVMFRGEVVYFCLPDCKTVYDIDPLNSCLAARLMLDR